MFLSIFFKRKPLRKPLHYYIGFKRAGWLLFIPIFALDNSNTNTLFIKIQHVGKGFPANLKILFNI